MKLINKIKNYINRRVLRTPGVEFFIENKDLNLRKKHLNFWLDKARKNKSFKKYFFSEMTNNISETNFKIYNNNYKITDEMFSSLSNNGLLIIENALPQQERSKILEYFDELKKNDKFEKNWLKKPFNPKFFDEVNEIMGPTSIYNFRVLNEYSSQFSNEIYGKIVEPTVEFRYLKQKENSKEKKTKGATYLHSDRFLPHFKLYYAPHEITIEDAPLEYVLSSHKINNNFINFYLNSENFDETDKEFKNFNFEKKIVCVPENTLYVVFTNGFHKRSQFNGNSERSLVFLQYVERFNKLNYLF